MSDAKAVLEGLTEAQRKAICAGSPSGPRKLLFDLPELGLASPLTGRLAKLGLQVRALIEDSKG